MRALQNDGLTLLELIVAMSLTFAIAATCVGLLVSANDMLDMALTAAYVLETDRTVFGIFASDLAGLAYERTTVPTQSEDFDETVFAEDDPLALTVRDVSLLILTRDYTDYEGRSRAADVLFLQTTGAGDAEGDGKCNPLSRVLYCLCVDDGDGDRSNDPAVILPDTVCVETTRLTLLRSVWYSKNSFTRLALPDANVDTQSPEEMLLAEDVVAMEIRVMLAGGETFERRTTVHPDAASEKIIAVQIILTLREPYNDEEREVREVFYLAETECY